MKNKAILSVCACLLLMIFLVGCASGENSIDVRKYAIVKLPNGDIVEGEVQSITRWSASLVDVKIDGKTYSVHPINLAIVYEGE